MLIGHGQPSQLMPKIDAIVVGGREDFAFWRMKNDPDFANVVFRVQRGCPEGTKPGLVKMLKSIYGKKLNEVYFLSVWVKAHDGKMTKTTMGTETEKGPIPVGFSKEGIVNLLRATLSSPVMK